MISNDKAADLLLELANPRSRRTRSAQLDVALRTGLALAEADAAVFVMTTGKKSERLVLHSGSSGAARYPSAPTGSVIVPILAGNGQPLVYSDLSEEAEIHAADGCPGVEAGAAIFTAVPRHDPVPGYVAVYRRRGRPRFTAADRRSMQLLCAWLGAALESLRLSSGAEKISITDDLTEIYNARFISAALRRELRRAGRFGQELSIVLISVDRLETWQQEQGELRASVLLKEVASLLAQHVRSFDLLARYRSDQFMVILPQTPRDGAADVAERMRAVVEGHAFLAERSSTAAAPGSVTVSLGVASFPQGGTELEALVASVERALRQAQKRGMNCVEVMTGVTPDTGAQLRRIPSLERQSPRRLA